MRRSAPSAALGWDRQAIVSAAKIVAPAADVHRNLYLLILPFRTVFLGFTQSLVCEITRSFYFSVSHRF